MRATPTTRIAWGIAIGEMESGKMFDFENKRWPEK